MDCINLSSNSLVYIDPGALPSVNRIYLSNNNLQKVPELTFFWNKAELTYDKSIHCGMYNPIWIQVHPVVVSQMQLRVAYRWFHSINYSKVLKLYSCIKSHIQIFQLDFTNFTSIIAARRSFYSSHVYKLILVVPFSCLSMWSIYRCSSMHFCIGDCISM